MHDGREISTVGGWSWQRSEDIGSAGHAFHNDTGARYNAEAAADAWARTLAWFEQYVKGG